MALLVLGSLVTGAAGVVAAYARPSEWPPRSSGDQWAAEGAVFAAGAFVLAILATGFAAVAYVNSTLRPRLRISYATFPGWSQPLILSVTPEYPSGWAEIWTLNLRLVNDGAVAARYVAVRLRLQGASLYRSIAAKPSTLAPLDPWKASSPMLVNPNVVRWEGGADAVVHPGGDKWEYEIPELGPVPLVVDAGANEFTFDIDVIADEVRLFSSRRTVRVERRRRGTENLMPAERVRRDEMLRQLHAEYCGAGGSRDLPSLAGVLAGTETLPPDWANARLIELGEDWRIENGRPGWAYG
jgi:hypothetical protein